MTTSRPLIVGIGGSTRRESSSERLLQACLARIEQLGARTLAFSGQALQLAPYEPAGVQRSRNAVELVDAVRDADGLVIASPGYHGGISGLVKNALDYVEDLRGDARPYLDGRAVGCIASASGWQAAVSTLQALRAVVHALRGWPTPLGIAVNSGLPVWGADGVVQDAALATQMEVLGEQIMGFAHRWGTCSSSAQTSGYRGSAQTGRY